MLSIKTWKSGGDAAQYYTKESEVEYYAQDGEQSGRWRGAEALDLAENSPVGAEQLESVLQGFAPGSHSDPDTPGLALTQNSGPEHRPGYDLTFSAPKSVSILWALGDGETREKVFEAHQAATSAALDHIDEYAAITRRGKGGVHREPVQNLIVAKFDHASSREHDPQLHTHCFVANVAQRSDGTWGTIESKYLYQEKMAAGAVYRAELAQRLQRGLGVEIRRKDREFEVKGVPEKLIKEFSKRREAITLDMAKKGYETSKAAEKSNLATRAPKREKSFTLLQQEWQVVGRQHGFEPEKAIGRARYQAPTIDHQREIGGALTRLTENQSTFTGRELRREIATSAQGRYGRDGIRGVTRELAGHPEVMALGKDLDGSSRYTSREIYGIEQSMFAKALTRAKETGHQIGKTKVERTIGKFNKELKEKARGWGVEETGFRGEQVAMIKALTIERGGIKVAMGVAGSGKSTALDACRDIWQKAGYEVRGLAPTGKAAQNLEKAAKIPSQTIDRFMGGVEQGYQKPLSRNDILVVDEAAMMGSRKLDRLLNHAHAAGSKVVLVGDHRQLQPIEAGSPVRMLREGLGGSELSHMGRQKEEWQRKAAQFFSQGRAEDALREYAMRDQLFVHNGAGRTRADLVSKYVDEKLASPKKSFLVLSETNSQVDALNLEIRGRLKEKGYLKDPVTIRGNDRGGKNQDREFATGDRILFTQNSRKLGVQNGLFGQIEKIEKKNLGYDFKIKTDAGNHLKVNTADYKHLEHGYAATVYKSQGDTVDKTFFLVADRASRESSYVAMSRHRENAYVFIDRSGFSENLDWDRIRGLRDRGLKEKEITHQVVRGAGSAMSRSSQKDTTMDYKDRKGGQEFVTQEVRGWAESLDSRSRNKVGLLFQIAVAFRGSGDRFSSPPSGLALYQKEAARMLKKRDFSEKALFDLKKDIFSLEAGFGVEPNERMSREKAGLEKSLEPSKQRALEHNRGKSLDKSHGMDISF